VRNFADDLVFELQFIGCLPRLERVFCLDYDHKGTRAFEFDGNGFLLAHLISPHRSTMGGAVLADENPDQID